MSTPCSSPCRHRAGRSDGYPPRRLSVTPDAAAGCSYNVAMYERRRGTSDGRAQGAEIRGTIHHYLRLRFRPIITYHEAISRGAFSVGRRWDPHTVLYHTPQTPPHARIDRSRCAQNHPTSGGRWGSASSPAGGVAERQVRILAAAVATIHLARPSTVSPPPLS